MPPALGCAGLQDLFVKLLGLVHPPANSFTLSLLLS